MHKPHICGLAVQTGVWLIAKETEISATPWILWLGKDFLRIIALMHNR